MQRIKFVSGGSAGNHSPPPPLPSPPHVIISCADLALSEFTTYLSRRSWLAAPPPPSLTNLARAHRVFVNEPRGMDLLPGKNFPPAPLHPSFVRSETRSTTWLPTTPSPRGTRGVRAANYYFIPVGERIADSSAIWRWVLLIKASLKDRF